jgi:membrane protease YdiL (CAAX protease family)
METHELFFNRAGRLRSGWRLGIFTVVLMALMLLVTSLVRVVYGLAMLVSPDATLGSYLEDVVFRILILTSALLAGLICNRWLESLPWRALGLWFHRHWLRDLCLGSLIGIGSLALTALIAFAAGGVRFAVSGKEIYAGVLQTVLSTALLFIIAALAEESLFRGYPLQTLSRAGLVWLAVLLTSVPFAIIHLGNPNATAFSSINTGLAGIWLAAAYLRTRSLWLPLGVHWAWNWAQASILGLPVSGITNLAAHPVFRASDRGPAWLTGGSYGPEGGVACTVALVLSTLFILRTRWVSATDEMKMLTSQENPVSLTTRQKPDPAVPGRAARRGWDG